MRPGWYWMLCGVPGHALEGEYIGLQGGSGGARPACGQDASEIG